MNGSCDAPRCTSAIGVPAPPGSARVPVGRHDTARRMRGRDLSPGQDGRRHGGTGRRLMAPRFIRVPWLPGRRTVAVCIGQTVFWRGTGRRALPETLRVHESIHAAQWAECGAGFLAIYDADLMAGIARGLPLDAAYRAVRFEREAYAHEHDASYLETRRPFAWRDL